MYLRCIAILSLLLFVPVHSQAQSTAGINIPPPIEGKTFKSKNVSQYLESAPVSIYKANDHAKENPLILNLEVANSEQEREIGLMYRSGLDNKSGMLFLFGDNTKRSFWMKNTMIPLDILYVDQSNKIVKIHKETTPYSLEPLHSDVEVIAAIELSGGQTDKHNIEVGDIVDYSKAFEVE